MLRGHLASDRCIIAEPDAIATLSTPQCGHIQLMHSCGCPDRGHALSGITGSCRDSWLVDGRRAPRAARVSPLVQRMTPTRRGTGFAGNCRACSCFLWRRLTGRFVGADFGRRGVDGRGFHHNLQDQPRTEPRFMHSDWLVHALAATSGGG